MLERQLESYLRRAEGRLRSVRMLHFLAAGWTLLAAVGAALLLASLQQGAMPAPAIALAAAAAVTAAAAWLYRRLRPLPRVDVARQIERRHPELDACLVTAVEQQPQFPNGRYGVLQEAVFRRALIHARRHPWHRSVVAGRLWKARLASVAALLLLATVTCGLLLGLRPGLASTRLLPPPLPTDAQLTAEMTVEPGDTEIERGRPLIVLARFAETAQLPVETTLVWEERDRQSAAPSDDDAAGQTADDDRPDGASGERPAGPTERRPEQRQAMTKSLGDPVFGGRIAAVTRPLQYRVEYGGRKSAVFRVTVFEYPRLDRADARLELPGYTGQAAKLVEDTRSVAAVEGAQVTWTCHLNKAVAEARLESDDGELIPLQADAADPRVVRGGWAVAASGRYTLRLVDGRGRENQRPAELRVRALPNRPPQIKITRPARDLQVSPLEEVPLAARLSDDFGLVRFGLTLQRPGLQPADVVLGEDAPGGAPQDARHLLQLERLQVEPDQLLTYFFWAEDIDASGQVRTTHSDMFFLEVRPFEEIFREGEPQPPSQQQQQQQGGAAQQAEELAKLQKQIINATWKVVRQRPAGGALVESAELLSSSQADAVEMASQLGDEIQDAESRRHLSEAIDAMMQARELLEAGADEGLEKLRGALGPEQQAYQSLLRLRAREHEVVQQQSQSSQSSSSPSSSSPRSRQQLQQLQLDNQENRYETQRQAQSLQDPEQRETRQTLNRLRELAQRQEDVNKRVKELQAALEEAESDEQREELQRQLKRLRDEQQQVLRDVDELQNRAEASQAEESQQLEQKLQQTREQVRQADEALRQQNLSQAIAEGTRAEQQLSELRDEVRRQAAGQFDEQAREMRRQARELSERQQQIAEEIRQQQQAPAKSLRDPETTDGQSVQQRVNQQREQLDDLLENVQDTVEAAEEAEPLLARNLYDTFRKARQDQIDRNLEETERWLESGFLNEAQPAEEKAREGIERLREGVEQAAESVLGDPAEALRRAEQELEGLAEELRREMQENQGQPQHDSDQQGQPRQGQPQQGQPQQGQPQQGQPQQGQPQQGQPQQGQPQQGQPQQGQPQQGQPQQGQPQQGQPQQGQPQQGQPQQGQPQQGQSQQGQPQQGQPQQGQPQQGQPQEGAERLGGIEQMRMTDNWAGGPITGGGYRDWTDRMRDVEEMVEDSQLRSDAARIRDRVRNLRMDLKRHSKKPNWPLVEEMVARPLEELRNRVAEELRRRSGEDDLVPLDRDPVPERFEDRVRRYYRRLGSGR